MVAATAHSGGADIDEIVHFIRRTCATADIFHQGTMVCYSRPDGSGHCVLQRRGRYLRFQHSDEGVDLTHEVNDPANSIAYCWAFVESVYWELLLQEGTEGETRGEDFVEEWSPPCIQKCWN